MSSKFKANLIEQFDLGKGIKETKFKYIKKGKNTKITREEVIDINNDINKALKTKYGNAKAKQAKTLIRGLNSARWTTIKGMDMNQIADNDEYYALLDNDNFNDYFFLEVTIII